MFAIKFVWSNRALSVTPSPPSSSTVYVSSSADKLSLSKLSRASHLRCALMFSSSCFFFIESSLSYLRIISRLV